MTINETYLVSPRATVTLNYIPVIYELYLLDSMTHFLALLTRFLGILVPFLDFF